jgi:hypothetical protein
MRHAATIALIAAAFCATATAQVRRPASSDGEEGIYSRTIIHPDETRTVSKQDLNNKLREKRTLDKNGILLMRSIFQLSASGQPINNASRLEEERVFDARGTLVRRLFYKPDRMGRMKPVSQTIFENGGQRSSASGDLENYSTNSPHAYRGGSGVQNTPGAYKRPSSPAPSTRTKKRERRFRIFRSRD